MADMLKFRKGLFKNLPEVSASTVGTIYVTTDEQAMYVDVAADKRIRISDFIRVSTVKDIVPPFSTSSLYYVEADNALLKYVETTVDGVTTGTWKQVNGTDDLRASLSALTERVSSAEGKITTAEGKITTAEGKIAALETAVGVAKTDDTAATGLHADIEALKAAVGMNEDGEVEGLAGTVAQIRADLTTAEGEIDALQELTNTHSTDIANLKADAELHADKSYVDDNFVLKSEVEDLLENFDVTGSLKDTIDAAVKVEKDRAEAAEKALDDAVKAVKNTADGAVQSTTFEAWKTENTAAIGTAKAEAIESANGYADGLISAEVTRADNKYATKTALEATNEVVAGHTSSLATLNGTAETAGSVNWAKAAADAAMAEAQKKTTMADVEAKGYATKTEAQAMADAKDQAITAAQNAANAAQSDATQALADALKANTAIGDANGGLVKDIADNKAAAAAAQKAIDDYSAAHAGDYTNEQIDTKVKAVSDVVAGHTTALEGLTGENGAVAKAQAAADKAQSDIDEYKEAHKDDMTNEQINAAIKVAKDAADAAQGDADANAQAITALQGKVDTLNGDANTPGSVAKAVADAKSELNTEIANKINAANAMDYKGGVASEDALFQKTDVKMGDTYVATVKFTFTDGTVAYPGDLIIAQGDEENGVIADPTWEVVKTGYDASLEQTITTSSDGKIQLTSAIGANNGQVAFVAEEGSAAKVTVANNTVTIGMEWEDFE